MTAVDLVARVRGGVVGGTGQDLVSFCGSGATAAVAKLVGLLELAGPSVPAGPRPVVFVGPYEHHSNLLPWRESAAEVVAVGEDGNGQVDLDELEALLVRHAGRPLLVGAFSAASNVTGILTDTDRLAALLHRHGALSVWDYSAAAPTCPSGWPPAPPGGRRPQGPREEGGTPGIVESVRAGLVVALKQAVGTNLIREREQRFLGRALERWRRIPNLELLGNLEADRLPIVSFRVRRGPRYLHHELVVAMLNDLFGIQARGGCSCAGPYGHRLLGIDPDRSRAPERAGRPRLPGHQAGLGPGQLQLVHLRRGRRLPGRRGRPAGRPRAPAARRVSIRPVQRPVAPPPGRPRPGPVPGRAARGPLRPRARARRGRGRPGRLPRPGPGAAGGRRPGHRGGGAELAATPARAAARLPPAYDGLGRRASQVTAAAATTARARARPTLPVSRSAWRQPAPAA